MNKKGTEKILSLYWFAILMLVAGGVFAMVYVFYGSPYDVREIEADALIDRIADCLASQGRINSEIIKEGNFDSGFKEDFLRNCHLILDGEWDEEQYYIEIDFYNFENPDNSVYGIKKGNSKWASSCVIQEEEEHERLAKCIDKSFYSLDELDNQYLIKILVAVRKLEKNVKQ